MLYRLVFTKADFYWIITEVQNTSYINMKFPINYVQYIEFFFLRYCFNVYLINIDFDLFHV